MSDPLADSLVLVADLIAGRRSVRRYTSHPVDDNLVAALLRAALWAPSAHNRQPWRFAVVKTPFLRARLARAMGERLGADRTRDGDAAAAVEADVARSYTRISSAPCVILACYTLEDMDVYPDARRIEAEHQMAIQSSAMALQNLLLVAHAAGVGACCMCAPLFCPDVVKRVLRLPSDWRPQALVTLGYPADPVKPSRRRPLSDVVRFIEEWP